jgi:hypothetical protein
LPDQVEKNLSRTNTPAYFAAPSAMKKVSQLKLGFNAVKNVVDVVVK